MMIDFDSGDFSDRLLYRQALEIVVKLQHAGSEAFFVGGAVRDMLLGKMPKDIDIVTSALPEQVLTIFPESKLVGVCFGVVNVPVNHVHYEVATFREERDYCDGRRPEQVKYTTDPRIDSQRRDFTVNGLYYDPVEEKIYDYVGGIADIKRGIVRAIGDAGERFAEDYLRMLRAIRFAARFGFALTDEVKKAIAVLADKTALLSAERVREELDKMLVGPYPELAVTMLKETGVLSVLLPEVMSLDGVAQPEKYHPEGDVLVHTLLMLQHMAYPSVELAWSILLHDIAKPETLIYDAEGVEHFYGHEEAGAEKARTIMVRLKFPNKTTETVVHAVRNHMRFAHVHQMREAKLRRLIAEPDFALELELHRIDCISSHSRLQNFILLLDKVNALKNEIQLPEPLLNGKDLISWGLKPGPRFGELLKALMNAQLEGQVHCRDEAVKFTKELIQK